MNPMPTTCPFCDGGVTVQRLYCGSCQVTIDGAFDPYVSARPDFAEDKLPVLQRLAKLSAEQLEFLEAFVRSEGKFNRLEEEIGFSYPTLRARFSEIVQTLGGQPRRGEESSFDRKQVLADLAEGKIDAAEATRRLRQGQ